MGLVLVQGAAVVAVLALLWLLPEADAHLARARALGRRLGLVPPPVPAPVAPPIEQIAADLWRIGSALHDAPPGTPVARRRGWLAAYDDVLVAACRGLDLDQSLESYPPGARRDLERERVERMLVRAGLGPLRR
ncbi:hypothetical protein [Nocardioides sp. cx-173]|uniref:hypothetical protein n=1 Tax=Nocardioides sp. cx-173 TaxID=2898796 RepID=UPI001E4B8C8E|nr:hypothetical protein [Nocardioides sp. cx-173]MCD4525389.1 hypothetical protein [Nocardioides sp. cx-173]UGB40815.1 hypothetical protein LQ940_15715 [Nocardioides sp. cx-173]